MAITQGQNANASDFIDESERDATPANDAGKVPKLEGDGRVHPFFVRIGKELTAGETLAGETSPVPVYQNKTDNELYACDANDADKMKFIGFVITDSTNGNPIRFQGAGVVSGFTGLAEGEKYYVQDAAGTIGASPGTYEVLVGVAISETELLIQKGKRYASGTLSGITASGGPYTITVGFRVSRVRIHAVSTTGGGIVSLGGWTVQGAGKSIEWSSQSGSPVTAVRSFAYQLTSSGGGAMYGDVGSVTDTTFQISANESGSPVPTNVRLFWEAEGDL